MAEVLGEGGQVKRRRGRLFVLTGTASVFRSAALREVAAQRGRLLPGRPGDVYDTVALTMPAVISVGDAINEPRYPSLKAIMGAKKKPLDTKSIADVGIEAAEVGQGGSQTTVIALNEPPAKEAGEIIEDEDTAETVDKIVAWLDERKLI